MAGYFAVVGIVDGQLSNRRCLAATLFVMLRTHIEWLSCRQSAPSGEPGAEWELPRGKWRRDSALQPGSPEIGLPA